MRTLVISQHLPLRTHAHGVIRRLSTFAAAFDGLGEVDFLFLGKPHKNFGPKETSHLIAETWVSKRPRVSIIPDHEDAALTKLGRDYLLPATTIRRQIGFAKLCNNESLTALKEYLADPPDLIFAHRLPVMTALRLTGLPLPPVFFDLDDIEHVIRYRNISQPPHWATKRLLYLQLPALWWGERAAILAANITYVCSKHDRQYLSRTMGVRNVEVVPNAISPPATHSPVEDSPPNVLFVGAYSYPPNAIAADLLITKIWPIIRKAHPDAQLLICGLNPELIPSFTKAHSRVQFLGFIDDLNKVYANSRVVCVPIRSGGGTRVKIIEAAMHRRPVVSTTIGAEGLEFQEGTEILLSDDTAVLASLTLELLRDPTRCRIIVDEANRRAVALYSKTAVIAQITRDIKALFSPTSLRKD